MKPLYGDANDIRERAQRGEELARYAAQHGESTTKPIAESGWSELRHAINDMNNQPDISANDSPRLKEFCRVTATEIKAVGGVSAGTSLEMIGYIRELERSQVGEDDHVAWCRYKYNSEGGIQSIATCDSDAKGAFKVYRVSPSDFEQLIQLRNAALDAERFLAWWCEATVPNPPKGVRGAKATLAALREALIPKGKQS